MSIAELGSIGEFVGSLLVLATLVFLVFQMRQNTNAIKSSMAADLTAHFISNSHVFVTDEDMADLLAKSLLGESDSFSHKEKTRLFYWAMASLKAGDFAHYQWLNGNLDDDLWVGTAETLSVSFKNPDHPWSTSWPVVRSFCSPQFQDYIDAIRS